MQCCKPQHRPTCGWGKGVRRFATAAVRDPYPPANRELPTTAPTDIEYDAVIVGGGMGGLSTAARLVTKGAKVVVLEK